MPMVTYARKKGNRLMSTKKTVKRLRTVMKTYIIIAVLPEISPEAIGNSLLESLHLSLARSKYWLRTKMALVDKAKLIESQTKENIGGTANNTPPTAKINSHPFQLPNLNTLTYGLVRFLGLLKMGASAI